MCIAFLTSCEVAKTYEDGYYEGFDDGYFDASMEYDGHSFEMYAKGYDESYGDFVEGVIEYKAIRYVREGSEWHPEEAMCIIDCYEKGLNYCGNYPITEKDYKEAVKSLYRYYEYFYNAWYKDDVECDYDFYD